jgi:hypothetical protein
VAALSPLLDDRERLAQMTRAGRARAADFDGRANADRLVSLYQNVLEANRVTDACFLPRDGLSAQR